MNLRIFMLCVKILKRETFSIRSNSAMRNGPKSQSVRKEGVRKCKDLKRISLARSKMVKSTYFLRNCAIVFGWVFHRLCKNLPPFNVLYESLRSTFWAPLLFFSHNQIFPFGILLVST